MEESKVKKIMAAAILSMTLLTATVQADDVLTPTKPLAHQSLIQEVQSLWHEFISYF